MPAAYTHYKFGQDVLYCLSDKKVREVIAHYPKMFDLGLYGPDLLFYYGIPSRADLHHLGFVLHRQEAAAFFGDAKDIILGKNVILNHEGNEKAGYARGAGLSYILGMICHFVLDCKCHDYIDHFIKNEGLGHAEVEMDLERELLARDGYSPIHYNPVNIQLSRKEAAQIARFYPGVTAREIGISLQHMRKVTGWLLPSNRIKKGTLHSLFGLSGHYHILKGLLIRAHANEACETTTVGLLDCYETAILVACDLMVHYCRYVMGLEELSPFFYRTYGAKLEEIEEKEERDKS